MSPRSWNLPHYFWTIRLCWANAGQICLYFTQLQRSSNAGIVWCTGVQVFMNEGKFPLIYLASPVSGLSLFFGVCFDAVHLPPPPPPNPTLTPTLLSIDFCWVRGGGRWAVAQILKLILLLHPPHHQYVPISIYISVYSFFPCSQKRL